MVKLYLSLLFFSALVMAQSVQLTWVQSTSPGITANNVYRAPASTGPWVAIFNSSTPIITYTDKAVILGKYYCWVVTAVTVVGESTHSNTACRTVTTMAPTKLIVK